MLDYALLSSIEKPAQYSGQEYNRYCKDWDHNQARMAFLFPDTYEIGMSHLGLRLLYEAVNCRDGLLMERCFAPQTDLEAALRARGIPLFSWESRHPLTDFDILGFTLQYELSYTNILNMLDLAGLPLLAAERPGWPLIIAGGPCAYNPEPLADFIDLFIIGEAEEILPRLLAMASEVRAGNGSKEDLIKKIAAWPGIYIPSFYQIEYDSDGKLVNISNLPPALPQIRKQVIADLAAAPSPTKPLVPNIKVVHDRIMLELMRGCSRGCRFCQAGMIYRPVREKDLDCLLKQAREQAAATGYDEMGLLSLSSADYSQIIPLVEELLRRHGPQGVSISLPSLRVDAFSVGLAHQIQKVRKSGLTLAPEAGSQHLRDIINKGVSEEDILTASGAAFAAGWSSLKLYFMLGLPGETDEDIIAIAALCKKILENGRHLRPAGSRKPLQLSLAAASFVPKSHTPFQWQGQASPEELAHKQKLLRESIRPLRSVTLKTHDIETSLLEAVFARGDRRLGPVLLQAWQKGCKFDGWSEHFRPAIWEEAFAEQGLNQKELAGRNFSPSETLPWEHIDSTISKTWLWQEWLKAKQGELTKDCREGVCSGCGACC